MCICLLLLTSACASLPTKIKRGPSTAFADAPSTSLGRLLADKAAQHPDNSGIYLLDTGKDAFLARLALLELAEQAIDLQYYIWNSDDSGRLLAERLLKAADRGVRVRLLLDDFNIADRDLPLVILDSHPNVEVRIYNPNAARKGLGKWFALVGEFGRINQRMHNKSFIVDGSAAITGGRNIGDEYFDLHTELNFRDRDLLTAGPVVGEISESFDAYWNSERAYPVTSITDEKPTMGEIEAMRKRLRTLVQNSDALYYSVPSDKVASEALLRTWLPTLIWANTEFVFDRPPTPDNLDGNTPKRVAKVLRGLAQAANDEVLIESAYLILGDDGLVLLKEMTKNGVQVRALTNSLASNDLTTNHSGYARRRPAMLQNGIELFEFRPDAASCKQLVAESTRCGKDTLFGLHAKSIVFDRKAVFVGSFNLNLRSVYLNTETALIVYSAELASRIAIDIKTNMKPENSWQVMRDEDGDLLWVGIKNGTETRDSHEPTTGFWRRFKSSFLSMFPLEKYL